MRLAALLTACAISCGDTQTMTAVDAPPPAAFTVTVAPDPIVEAPCGGCGPSSGQLWAVGTVTIQETAGAGASVQRIAMRLARGGETIAEGSFDAAAVGAIAGSNRVPARGALAVPEVGPHYDEALGGMNATLTFTIDLTDDGGHPAQKIVDVAVVPQS
jgi:hypothetical protein